MYEQILYDVVDPVATITLNRPPQLNAWTDHMASEVKHAVACAEQDAGKQLPQHGRLAQALEQLGRELPGEEHDRQDGEEPHDVPPPCGPPTQTDSPV